MKIFIFLFSVILFTNVYFTSVSCELVRFNVVNSANVTCLMVEFDGKVNHSIANVSEDIAGTVDTSRSSCSDTMNVLTIDGNLYTMRLTFTKVNSSIVFSDVSFNVERPVTAYTLDKDMFTVPEGKSFKCDSGITEYLTNQSGGTVKMELKEMRINAFRTADDGTEYEPDSVCAADGGSKTVPMIIAFVLAGMVVIMLVGYIILRKKEDKSTYQTV
ncbi:uncharacterized protein LOC128389943 [Panonychus citri]|uniref:uncharacterized protein LOC128389943 n=1 Tax=Panonychus citri TaxID=50023 RepID=UPI002308022A|nr:uncharacterized protein LOC128389943 [Panonychus citri]